MATKKKMIKIVAATSVTVFSLLACFMGTWAWFSAVHQKSLSGNEFTISSGSPIKVVNCYAVRYDGQDGAVATDLSSGSRTIEMSEYDYVFRDRNVHTPVFFRFEVSGFDKTKDLQVTIPCTGAFKKTVSNQEVIDNNLSNVVCAKFMRGLKINGSVVKDTYTWTGDNVKTAAVKSSYEGMLANAQGVDGEPFINASTSTKAEELTLVIPAATAFSNDFIFVNNGIESAIFFVVLDYYVTSSANYVENYIQSYTGLASHPLVFASDIGKMDINNV